MESNQILTEVCKALTYSIPDSIGSIFWAIVSALWSWYGVLIIIFLIVLVVIEIVTRNGNLHYNSENGFSPTFNIVIGSGTFSLFQVLTYLVLEWLFGGGVYCRPWSYLIHTFVFFGTGGFLNLIGFWVYWRMPFSRRKHRRK